MKDSAARIPPWAKKNVDLKGLHAVKSGLRHARLASVCEEARCPNISECFTRPCATFLILGDVCTRSCRFCSIRKGTPSRPAEDEGSQVAEAALAMGLTHIVITSVSRDDLDDKGAGAFARAVREVRKVLPGSTIEVLVPDFSGRRDLVDVVLNEMPDVFNHNVETIGRLYPSIRPQAGLKRSLEVLKAAREHSPDVAVKSGFMVGLGENEDEIRELLEELSGAGCDIVTIGQYLRPTLSQVPVERYWTLQDFENFSDLAKTAGIRYAMSAPLVRSSYRAGEVLKRLRHDRERSSGPAVESSK